MNRKHVNVSHFDSWASFGQPVSNLDLFRNIEHQFERYNGHFPVTVLTVTYFCCVYYLHVCLSKAIM